MRANVSAAILVALWALPAPCVAGQRSSDRNFNVPAGSLVNAIISLATQSGTNIVTVERDIARVRVRGVRGVMTLETALDKLLAGTGYIAVWVDGRNVRIERARKRQRPPAAVAPPEPPPADIVVTASKQRMPLADYPGSVAIAELDTVAGQASAARGTAAIVAQFPTLAMTSLGTGRDKVFVRGVADSSFTGPTQSTVGQYLGEARLTYNAPDPDLNLYDMKRVEILQGPQGTLYGAGSLGGIIRFVPEAAVIGQVRASLSAGLTTTRHGGLGNDAAAMFNLPIASNAALRVVGYRSDAPGYIDDIGRDLRNVNRSHSIGGRASLRIVPADGWVIEPSGVYQNTRSRDAQYTERTGPPLSRSTMMAEPASNEFLLGHILIRRRWDTGLEFLSNASLVHQNIQERYDATDLTFDPRPIANDVEDQSRFFSTEARLSRITSEGRGWIFGGNLIVNDFRVTNRLSQGQAPNVIVGVSNHTIDAAIFGQATFPLAGKLNATVGGRWSFARMSTDLISLADEEFDFDRGALRVRFLPTAALSLRLGPSSNAFLRYQQGYRAGGVAVGSEGVSRFRPDLMQMLETGIRFGQSGNAKLSGSAALSWSRWNNIQADLKGAFGTYTTNIGDGFILGLDAALEWRPIRGLSLTGALFAAQSRVTDSSVEPQIASGDAIPNTPRLTTRLGANYRFAIDSRTEAVIHGTSRYVGRSWLGLGPELHFSQGRYFDTSLGLEVKRGDVAVSLDLNNILDSRGNRFSYGNPFRVGEGNQETPLRPRTFRLGLRKQF